jgi:glycosyltransferase involved in cell wall biosynthesis
VIVATHNRAELLRQCLTSFIHQSSPVESFELVVVDDGSTDDTQAVLAGLELPFTLAVVQQSSAGSAAARNAGALRASGRVLVFIDDDEVAEPGFVAAHLRVHEGRERIVAIGAIEQRVPEGADRLARLQMEDMNAHIEVVMARAAFYLDLYGGNFSITRSTFDEAGGFANDLPRAIDTEFGYRLHELGCEFVFVRDALMSEFRTRPWHGIVADTRLRGAIAVELYRRHPGMLPRMALGGFAELSRSWQGELLDKTLLALHVSPRQLARIGFVFRKREAASLWFWFALTHAYWCGVRDAASPELWRALRSGTLVLAYHAFGIEGEKASRFVVPGKRFARQLRWLKARGYNVVSLGEYVEAHTAFRLLPPKTLVITIDDGYVDNATVARPLLERAGFSATVFLVSSAIEPETRSDPVLRQRPLLPRESAQERLGPAIEIGAHSRTHPRLTELTEGEAEHEISGSKLELEQTLGRPVTVFAYPFGDSNAPVRELVERAGFAAARGTKAGRNRPATDPYDLRWVEVQGTDSLLRFAARLLFARLQS